MVDSSASYDSVSEFLCEENSPDAFADTFHASLQQPLVGEFRRDG